MGARLLDELYSACLSQGNAAKWKEQGQSRQAEVTFADNKLLLVRSLKYMNISGPSIAEVVRYYRLEPQALLVLYDDLDLPLGNMRIRIGGGDGGHNGVGSLIESLGSAEFLRLKLGIGRPAAELVDKFPVSDWVLGSFGPDEEPLVTQMLQRGFLAIEELLRSGLKTAQNKFN